MSGIGRRRSFRGWRLTVQQIVRLSYSLGWARSTHSVLAGTPDPIRDPIMRHGSRFFTFQDAYLNEHVEFDLQNAFLEEEQEPELLRRFDLAGLTRGSCARRNMVPEEVWAKLPPDPEIQALAKKRAELKDNRGRAVHTSQPTLPPIKESPIQMQEPDPDPFSLLIEPNQCPDCIGDERMTLSERTFRYCRPTIRNDHFDDSHMEEREHAERRGESIRCYHLECRDMKFQHLDHFRNHVQSVHGVPLRSSDQVTQRRERKAWRRLMISKNNKKLVSCQA